MTLPLAAGDDTGWLRALGAATAVADALTTRARTARTSTGAGAQVGRVVRAERIAAEVLTPVGSWLAGWSEPVCTGDWVVVSEPQAAANDPIPGRVLWCHPRTSALVRRGADADVAQVLAANVEEAWIVQSADEAVPPGRIERALVVAWESGAVPLVLATKADRAGEARVAALRTELAAIAPGVEVVAVSTITGEGITALAARLAVGHTAALLGRSGAGKSSLVNALTGAGVAVGEVRARDGKGRHTTTWRELVTLPGGGALIDTPGLRAIGVWLDEGGVDAAYSDLAAMAEGCRFRDCAHGQEPGCALRAAVDRGTLDPLRLDRYLALTAEAEAARARDTARQGARAARQTAGRVARIRARDRRRSGE